MAAGRRDDGLVNPPFFRQPSHAQIHNLNRFPLFGLFAHQAARHMAYPEDDARLLGYSTALLYAIFKGRRRPRRSRPTDREEGTAHGDCGENEAPPIRRAGFPGDLLCSPNKRSQHVGDCQNTQRCAYDCSKVPL